MNLDGVRIGFAVTGSFCTFSKILPEMVRLVSLGARVQPIFSPAVCREDTRFFRADDFREKVYAITAASHGRNSRRWNPLDLSNA